MRQCRKNIAVCRMKFLIYIKRFLLDSSTRMGYLSKLGFYDHMSDEKYLKKKFKVIMGKDLNLDNPQTFNEKLQWLKLYNRKPEYTMMVDKYKVRDYIAEKLGPEYLIPLLGVWDNPDEIDFDELPNQFVLKCNHNSGTGMCICKDKSKLDVDRVKRELRKGLKEDYYMLGREWPYKNVPRKIIAEKYMEDLSTSNFADYKTQYFNEKSTDFFNQDWTHLDVQREISSNSSVGKLTDYKFFCFNGKVDCVMVCLDRASGDTKFYFFDKEWNLKRINIRGKNAPEGFTIPKPECMDAMFDIAARLSKDLTYARIDLYQCNGNIYFGEITFFPDSGFDFNLLPETDEYFGNLLDLPLIGNKESQICFRNKEDAH